MQNAKTYYLKIQTIIIIIIIIIIILVYLQEKQKKSEKLSLFQETMGSPLNLAILSFWSCILSLRLH